MMDRQDIYNRVRDHLLTQNKKATKYGGEDDTCMYRAPNGTKCGIGGIIPDELYNPEWDLQGFRIIPILERDPKLATYFGIETNTDRLFLNDLQSIHDNCEVRVWHQALTEFATQYGLQP